MKFVVSIVLIALSLPAFAREKSAEEIAERTRAQLEKRSSSVVCAPFTTLVEAGDKLESVLSLLPPDLRVSVPSVSVNEYGDGVVCVTVTKLHF